MKRISPASEKVPRLNSLFHRLQHTPGPDDDPHLDQLMTFLDDPPLEVRDRWKAGASLCAGWGISTTGTSVWRLYRSYSDQWHARRAPQESGVSAEAGIASRIPIRHTRLTRLTHLFLSFFREGRA
jgi:hypothetical protein